MSPSLSDLVAHLLDAKVQLILVGGLAAVAQGAPVTTFDVDVVHRRTDENVDRLLGALQSLHAFVRDPADRRLPPSREALLGRGHNLLSTDLGPLDCLGAIEAGLGYDELLAKTVELELRGRCLRVLELATLLELKERWTDEESRLRAAILRRTLAANRAGR
jgi:hypothetical protein